MRLIALCVLVGWLTLSAMRRPEMGRIDVMRPILLAGLTFYRRSNPANRITG